uniref:Uncharacterized protein n=1 Tax=Glossina palpalis gambiensis TaxID=67801 RepID=A0A1B0AWB6_9MUSC
MTDREQTDLLCSNNKNKSTAIKMVLQYSVEKLLRPTNQRGSPCKNIKTRISIAPITGAGTTGLYGQFKYKDNYMSSKAFCICRTKLFKGTMDAWGPMKANLLPTAANFSLIPILQEYQTQTQTTSNNNGNNNGNSNSYNIIFCQQEAVSTFSLFFHQISFDTDNSRCIISGKRITREEKETVVRM